MISMKNKLKSFSLVEVLVSLILFAIVLTSLFSLYKHNSLYLKELVKARKEAEVLHIAQTRLQQVFLNLNYTNPKHDKFYTSQQLSSIVKNSKSLVFTFDNGVDSNKYFSNDVLGKLFVDDQNRLCLVYWPSLIKFPNQDTNMRKEVLLENIEAFEMEFWSQAFVIDSKNKEEPGVWVKEWKKDYKDIPTIIKFALRYKYSSGEKSIELTYIVPKKIPIFKL
jgi:type II secretory pathway pseudopilin PulG